MCARLRCEQIIKIIGTFIGQFFLLPHPIPLFSNEIKHGIFRHHYFYIELTLFALNQLAPNTSLNLKIAFRTSKRFERGCQRQIFL